jgi:hypothetical protein
MKVIQAMTVFPARGRFTARIQADAIIINLAKNSSNKKQIDEVYRLS